MKWKRSSKLYTTAYILFVCTILPLGQRKEEWAVYAIFLLLILAFGFVLLGIAQAEKE